MYYYTQMVGDAVNMPTLFALPAFQGIGVLDADRYLPYGANWYTNQNNFYRQVRNFIIDITQAGLGYAHGIHWQVAQATSLQNIVFNMRTDGQDDGSNQQQGIFMDNGSGGWLEDLIFNGKSFKLACMSKEVNWYQVGESAHSLEISNLLLGI